MNKKTIILLLILYVVLVPTAILLHEYTHYLQARCHVSNAGIPFTQRLSVTIGGGGSVAYINVAGCPTPHNATEPPAYLVTVLVILAGQPIQYHLLKKDWRNKNMNDGNKRLDEYGLDMKGKTQSRIDEFDRGMDNE